ncbi:MAG: FapA family protein [Gammaproteobacteria bacterium]|nr:FapA family protein [Gammaproteobacteria bacterium]
MAAEPGSDAAGGVRFLLTDDRMKVVAKFRTPGNPATINRQWVQTALVDMHLDHLYLSESAIEDLIHKYNYGEPSGAVLIGERRDAKLTLAISPDKMEAYMDLEPAYGGQRLTKDGLEKALREKNIIFGLLLPEIKDALQKGQAKDVLIACGTPAIEGTHARFEVLIPEIKDRTPQVREDGMVDYRDLGEIYTVQPGVPVMRRQPARQGAAGTNVHGQTINPKQVKDANFSGGLEGVEVSQGDPDLLISTTTGQPVIKGNGVTIENVLRLKKVDLSTGNVKFDGSVEVEGEVSRGMKIEATGDIIIRGVVEAAILLAGGDVLVDGSIIGGGDVRDPKGELLSTAATIKAGAAVSFKVGEYVYVEAGDCIYVEELAMSCELHALNEVVVGTKNARRGQVVGGLAHSGVFIKVLQAGGQSGVKTVFEISYPKGIGGEIKKLDDEIAVQDNKLFQVKRTLLSFRRDPKNVNKQKAMQLIQDKRNLEGQIAELEAKKEKLMMQIERVKKGQVLVGRNTFAGTVIKIGNADKTISEDTKGVGYRLYEDKHIVSF